MPTYELPDLEEWGEENGDGTGPDRRYSAEAALLSTFTNGSLLSENRATSI